MLFLTRLPVAALAAAALLLAAVACDAGANPAPTSPADTALSSSPTPPADSGDAVTLADVVDVSLDVQPAAGPGDAVPLTLSVENTADHVITLWFSGDVVDYLVTDLDGQELWRFLHYRRLPLPLFPLMLEPGEVKQYETIWDQRDNQGHMRPSGPHLVTGIFNASLTDLPDPETVEAAPQELSIAGPQAQTGASVTIDGRSRSIADFTRTKRQVKLNIESMRGQLVEDTPLSAGIAERLGLIVGAGVENVALAVLIQDEALYAEALRRGYAAEDDELAGRIEAHGEAVASGALPEMEEYIDTVGEDLYWSELLPEMLAQDIAGRKMRSEILDGVAPQGQRAAWSNFERSVVLEAEIALADADAVHPATPAAALDYLEALWQLE